MHLKLDPEGTIDDGAEARDLGQPTADIVILSAADSELAGFAAAHARMLDDAAASSFPSVRFTNFLALGHPVSVDAYVERTLADAKVVILRMLGGESYWPHGVASLRADALARGIPFLCVPGEMHWDEPLAARSTALLTDVRMMWRYCVEGGPDNARLALCYAAHLIGHGEKPDAPRPMPAAGFWPQQPTPSGRPVVAVLFYRALAAGGATAPIDAMCEALTARGLDAVAIYVTSLKDERSAAFVNAALAAHPPDVIVNATAFATAAGAGLPALLDAFDCPVLQVALAGTTRESWETSMRGLSPRDLAMHVVMPEVDGRIFANVIAFKERAAPNPAGFAPTVAMPLQDRVDATADLAAAWVTLRRKPAAQRRTAVIVANYPNHDGRLANGVGLDTPASLAAVIAAMEREGYDVTAAPRDGAGVMALFTRGPTNDLKDRTLRIGGAAWPLAEYRNALARLPRSVQDAITARWGQPERDPHVAGGTFRVGAHRFGNLVVGVQPARGYNLDPKAAYHDPDLVPPHHYVAFYLWLREEFAADAIMHLGKHGNLEWLPGKSTGLSRACLPEAILGRLPHLYPFIVNDPGEGIQAKRRASAVIVDHLTPPLARAELTGDLTRLENLIDEYSLAADLDPKRARMLADEALSLARAQQIDSDLALPKDAQAADALRALDAHLCDLKEMQIRDGLHVFGVSPQAGLRDDLIVSIARVPRSEARPQDVSLHRALAADLGLGDFDPLARDLAASYLDAKPAALTAVLDAPWRTAGDTVERIELLALRLVRGDLPCPVAWTRSREVLAWIEDKLRPALDACGDAEMYALMRGIAGRFVSPGPSGAPTRGRPDVLPTGRNFYAVDLRGVPSESAWRIGALSAERLVESYWQENGEWPRQIALSAWGTANMRTGGDDVAQALALIGARPTWEPESGRVTGFRIVSLSDLKRPRVDVTLRVSGLFRDAFPTQIDLVDSAVRAIAQLDEPDDANPLAANVRARTRELSRSGGSHEAAVRQASYRVFGAKPGAYGAGLQSLIDEGNWDGRADLADAYLAWGGYGYGAGAEGLAARDEFSQRLSRVQLVAQAQDNREHDILDSDDYYQFMGGLAATVETLSGQAPRVAHIDTSRPEAPLVRSLSHEISRVVRGRASNQKWIAGVMRHGYKGAFEIAATVDYLFGFAASTDAVSNHHFDQLFAAYIEDERVRDFMRDANPAALTETAARFAEAIRRDLWRPRSNRARDLIAEITGAPRLHHLEHPREKETTA